jgi:NADPH:quinone reductase-like Zn-dependent oxidoreductase
MLAAQFGRYGDPEVLSVLETAQPHAGPGQIRIAVRASGVTPADTYLRSGQFRDVAPLPLPHTIGFDAAGIVDEIGDGVKGTSVGDVVFGLTPVSASGGATAQHAVLDVWAPKPAAWSWEQAGGAGANIETATRVLDALGVKDGSTLLIEGAAGGVGTIAVQLARLRGATVVGTASVANHGALRDLGALATTYGPGLAERVAALAPQGVDCALDAAGSGSLADLVVIAGGADRVVTIVDAVNAERLGVRMSSTVGAGASASSGRPALEAAASYAARGELSIPIHQVFVLADAAAAHRASESRHARGKIVITVPLARQSLLEK